MAGALNLAGKKFGYLTAMKRVGVGSGGCIIWLWLCDCGNEVKVKGSQVVNKHTQSCGCYNKELVTKHSLWNHPLYRTHRHILHRCYNPKDKSYKNYGARGIALYTPWHDVAVFIRDVIASIGDRPDGLELDRINNNKNYEPGNIKWATKKEQARNRRNNVWVKWQGQTRLLCELAEEHGIKRYLAQGRYNLGWDVARILST